MVVFEATVSPIMVTSTKVVPLGLNASFERGGLIMFSLLETTKSSKVLPSLSLFWLPHKRLWAFESIQITACFKFTDGSLT